VNQLAGKLIGRKYRFSAGPLLSIIVDKPVDHFHVKLTANYKSSGPVVNPV
jgi:hypothetical protein